jgi:hypothetical protein
MNSTAGVFSQYAGAWIVVGIGVLGAAILFVALREVLRFIRRRRDRKWDAKVARAFAEAEASGDPQAAELMAEMARAEDIRDAGRTIPRVR